MLADFRKLLAARLLFTAAVQMQAIMLGWRMYELTHDPLHLGFIGLVEAIPALSLSLFAGYAVDHGHPLRIYRHVLDASVVSALIFLASQWPEAGLSAAAQVAALYVSSFATGVARSFSQPAIYAIVPKLVPRAQLPRASAWTTTSMQVARIGGPALGGLMFGFTSVAVAVASVCVLLVASAGITRGIGMFPRDPTPARTSPLVDELLAGARFVFRHPILLPALSLDMLSVLFGGVTALLPVFAQEILAVGPKGLGVLRAAPALGAVFTSAWLTRVDLGARAGRLLLGSVAGFGACIVVFGLSHSFVLSAAALALSGAFDSVSMVIRGAAVQLESPPALRGRISAVNAIFIGSSNELGEFESGLAAWWLGTVPAVLAGGGVCLAVVGAVAVLAPRLRNLDLRQVGVGNG